MAEEVSLEDVRAWVEAFAAAVADHERHLTELDSAVGDADHGIDMDRGMRAAVQRLEEAEPEDIGALLKNVGMALVSKVGGAAGPLYGTLFLQMGVAASDREAVTPAEWAEVMAEGIEGVVARGEAEPGDKTMLDTLLPALEALEEALAEGASFGEALRRGAEAAREGMEATIPMVARKGRASYLGERSAGHQDPGATSSYLLWKAAADTWAA